MAQAKQGSSVKVHYTGKFQDGTVFDSSRDSDPMEFTLGEGRVIPGFENAVVGMAPGESRSVKIPADEAYGPYRAELVMAVDRGEMPDDYQPEVGDRLQLRDDSGRTMMVLVTEISDDTITFDANHPLAGEDLTFDIELEDIDE